MRTWFLFVALGTIAVASPIAGYLYYRTVHAREVGSVAELRRVLDAVSAELQEAASPADSMRLSQEVRARQEGIARRQYHVSYAEALLSRWWDVPGLFTVVVAAGAGAILAGFALRSRTRAGAA